jgi:hypothetical protein
MMKRFLLSLAVIGIGFLIVVISALSVGRKQVVGKAGAYEAKIVDVASASADPVLVKDTVDNKDEVNYYLAYPGILPDHPLYIFKMLRDRVKIFLIREPVAKAKLKWVLADKRIGAAWELAKGGKKNLADDAALRAEQYLRSVVDVRSKMNDEDKNRLGLAVAKHEEILKMMKEKNNMDDTGTFKTALEMNGNMVKEMRVGSAGE